MQDLTFYDRGWNQYLPHYVPIFRKSHENEKKDRLGRGWMVGSATPRSATSTLSMTMGINYIFGRWEVNNVIN